MAKVYDGFQLYPCFNGLPSESLEDYAFEVEALVARSKDDEKKLIGPRLIRRLGGIPGALARRELHMPDLAKPDGYKLILVFLEKKGYKKDALDRRLLSIRRYEAIARRPGQTLQDFFATENMAYADAVEARVGIDPDRRAYHMFINRATSLGEPCTLLSCRHQVDRFTTTVLVIESLHGLAVSLLTAFYEVVNIEQQLAFRCLIGREQCEQEFVVRIFDIACSKQVHCQACPQTAWP